MREKREAEDSSDSEAKDCASAREVGMLERGLSEEVSVKVESTPKTREEKKKKKVLVDEEQLLKIYSQV